MGVARPAKTRASKGLRMQVIAISAAGDLKPASAADGNNLGYDVWVRLLQDEDPSTCLTLDNEEWANQGEVR